MRANQVLQVFHSYSHSMHVRPSPHLFGSLLYCLYSGREYPDLSCRACNERLGLTPCRTDARKDCPYARHHECPTPGYISQHHDPRRPPLVRLLPRRDGLRLPHTAPDGRTRAHVRRRLGILLQLCAPGPRLLGRLGCQLVCREPPRRCAAAVLRPDVGQGEDAGEDE